MKTLRFLLLALLALVIALPAFADPIPLKTLSAYLNSIGSAEATFRQVNADGSASSGKVILKRPGRMRFEYARPDKTLVLASAGSVAIFDPKSNDLPTQYPLSKTPLNLILGPNIDLGRAKMVVAQREEGPLTIITAQDPEHPDYGTLELGFSDGPVTLRQWVVTDGSGAQTTVVLDALTDGKSYSDQAFSINGEIEARGKKTR